jgi:hypothetical protein
MRPLALVLLLAFSASASASGGPISGQPAGGSGVTTPTSDVRYVTMPSGSGTLVMRISRNGGRITRTRRLAGRWFVPAAAADGVGTGLSADGRTLVLGPPRNVYPIRRSRFQVLDAGPLRPMRQITLRGNFALDAISPDGGLLYLVQYTSLRDPTKYVVRAYDMTAGRLRPDPVVDPDEADEPMRGMPLSRTMSNDGRWAYTLYDGGGTHPFVHALDTAKATAVCVDLDQLAGRDDLWNMKVRTAPNGDVVVGGELAVDSTTFKVRDLTAVPAVRRESPSSGGDGPWPLIAAAIVAGFAALTVARRRRPRIGSA